MSESSPLAPATPTLVPGIPIVASLDEATEGMSYVATHVAIKNAVLAASIPIEKGVKDATTTIQWLAAPINPAIIDRMVSFFRAIHTKHGTEAGLLGEYNPESKLWRLRCPKQKATQAHVDMDLASLPPEAGWLRAMTTHSHGSMSAFHSGTDTADEAEFDGLHITVGRLDKEEPEFDVEVVVRGYRKKMALRALLAPMAAVQVPESWINQVDVQCGHTYNWPGYAGGEIGFGGSRPPSMPRQLPIPTTTDTPPVGMGKRARRKWFRRRNQGVPERIDGQMGLLGNRQLEASAQALTDYREAKKREREKAGHFKGCTVVGCEREAIRFDTELRLWFCDPCFKGFEEQEARMVGSIITSDDYDGFL